MQHGLLHSEMNMASQTMQREGHIMTSISPLTPQLSRSPPPTRLATSLLSNDLPRYHTEGSVIEFTPPASSSGPSSQQSQTSAEHGRLVTASKNINPDGQRASKAGTSRESPRGAEDVSEPIAAAKRTSSGQIKRSSISGVEPLNHGQGTRGGHARTSSVLSNGSSVTEVRSRGRLHIFLI
jgi:hypothetical protein